MAFNIYYINYPKVYEIKMMFDNFITVAKEVQNNAEGNASAHLGAKMGLGFLKLFSGEGNADINVGGSASKKVLETIRQAKDSLKDGVSLVVFPEGARTFTGHMGYFKKGAFQLADDLQLAVVPVTIDGSFEILPRTGKWIHRHRMILTIHEPIPPKGKGMENIKATMAEAYAAVESALPEQYKGMVKNEDQDR